MACLPPPSSCFRTTLGAFAAEFQVSRTERNTSMSMICYLRRLSAADLPRLVADSSLCADFLSGEEVEGFEPFADLDLDKAWHGIHYLLTGSATEGTVPLCFLLVGGQPIGEDFGYGPPRCFSPAEVGAVAAALSSVSSDALRARYDPKVMQRLDVYPGIWVREGDEGFAFVHNYFEELKQFVAGAAENGEALVLFLS
jgi:hypothetical protein